MARDNQQMNRFSIDAVKIAANDRVLEIGFGPGKAIELLIKRTSAPFIAGIDPSDVMVQDASDLNREAIAAGRVDLRQAAVERVPFEDGRFSRVLTVSNFQVWEDRTAGLAEIRRVLEPSGWLVVCLRRALRRPGWFAAPGVTSDQIAAVQSLLNEQGFRNVRIQRRRLRRRLVCILAQK